MDDILTTLHGLQSNELVYLIQSLQGMLLHKNTQPPVVDDSLYRLSQQHKLDATLLSSVHEHVKKLKYHSSSNSPNSPDIFLYGEQAYCYNKKSAAVKPARCKQDSKMGNLLTAVNKELKTKFNSMLINKYKNVHSNLAPHKDDEKCLDPTAPIASLSFGSSRRLQIYVDPEQSNPAKEVTLEHGSLFTMMPGFQDVYRHGITAGSKDVRAERGMRFSITFRRLLPENTPADEPDAEQPPPQPKAGVCLPAAAAAASTTEEPESPPVEGITVPDTLVFGSSLVKSLDVGLLSKHTRTFRVFCNRGAHVKGIYDVIEKARDDPSIHPDRVKDVFLLCGGNDVEDLKGEYSEKLKCVFEDMEDIVDLTREVFPLAKINFISLIPRRAMYRKHISNMHAVNNWLSRFCKKEKIRFVDVFSFFLVKTPREWWLNDKLFNGSRLHFSKVGDSVLAKVVIGVANLPQ